MLISLYDNFIFLQPQGLPLPFAAAFREITTSFLQPHPQTSSETIMLWVTFAATLILVFGIITLVRNMFLRKQVFIPAGWITSSRMVRNILNNAIIQRSTFEVQFTDKTQGNHPIVRCTPDNIDRERIALQVYGISAIAHGWIDREIACYFRINIKDQSVYYTFNSVITVVENKPRGMTVLWINSPERLQNRQKRSFLRLSPPTELILGSAIWHGLNLPPDSKLGDVSGWVKPNLAVLPNRAPQFYIKDLSAGGMRLRMPNPVQPDQDEHYDNFSVSENIIVLLDLHDPDSDKKIRFWLKCRIQNVLTDYNKQNIELGTQITAWAVPKEGGALEWLRLSRENEVAPLGNWIVHRHMEQFRTNPE
ncbi:MAG: hypothetical protein LBM00_04900 [Deltaproteobacteria bacterium]|jgi:hypothetical protein|nr:hypothetical protein [Deltaproteobacteria bacterium]